MGSPERVRGWAQAPAALVFGAFAAFGCAEILGADFDSARLKPKAGGGGGSEAFGGNAGGSVTGGGTSPDGGGGSSTTGGAFMGGEAGDAGASTGGRAGAGTAGAGGIAGDGGMAGEGGGGTGGRPAVSICNGAFGTAETLFTEQSLQSLSITADELELYYSTHDPQAGTRSVRVRKRDSYLNPFEAAVDLSEAATLPCVISRPFFIDVSDNGLNLYVACMELFGTQETLYVLNRSDRSSTFTLSTTTQGLEFEHFSVSANELTLWSADASATWIWQRETLDQDFPVSGRTLVPGIPGMVPVLLDPEPSAEGPIPYATHVYGTNTSRDGLDLIRFMPTGEYARPTSPGLPPVARGHTVISPAISGDCRSLYYGTFNTASPNTVTVRAAYREKCYDGAPNGPGPIDCNDEACADHPDCREICGDKIDNDHDQDLNCEDSDCADDPACP